MTVNDLILVLQRLGSPETSVYIPCPHCCGQRDTDFDFLEPKYIQTTERKGSQIVLLGDPGQNCLGALELFEEGSSGAEQRRSGE